ncbi:DUF3859 domain-containing protein [Thalassomonas viridans]|uniref:DUF3859 domain-containing protein n=1 Tax=Thalassomonas viridans TaxID=137584 RepID=A0AAE9Z822_9GAMM|nr:leucine-rich repeat domain-containing protein [Thalassomonas viridans]WDE07869.1 DUF3859 domain-containing protein [Thalassomonas viridans]
MPYRKVKFTLAGGLLATVSGCAMMAPESVDELVFKDANFAACVKRTNQPSLALIQELKCGVKGITSVEEIKYMPGLVSLNLYNNELTEIDTRYNPKLESLVVGKNKITSIDLSRNPELNMLNVEQNPLKSLDVSENKALKRLYAYKIPLTEIDVTGLSKLEDLGLSRHKLTSLDLSQNPLLSMLNLSIGTLAELDLSANPALEMAFIGGNKLTDIDFSKNPEITRLNVRDNQLTELDISGLEQLYSIKADYNQLATIKLGDKPELSSLELNNNQLTALNLENAPVLSKLVAFNNPLSELILADDNNISTLSVEGTPYALSTEGKAAEDKGIEQLVTPRVNILESGLIVKQGAGQKVTPGLLVKPQLGQYIGFTYSVNLPKDAGRLSNQVQFPITVRMTHPELTNPKNNHKFSESKWTDTMFKNNTNLAWWYFGEAYELVEGRWKLDILYRDSVIASKSYLLIDPNKSDEERDEDTRQALMMHELVLEGDKTLCAESKFRGCLDFESQQACVTALTPHKNQCRRKSFYHLRGKANQVPSVEQLRSYFSDYTACMSMSYIKQQSVITADQVSACFTENAG